MRELRRLASLSVAVVLAALLLGSPPAAEGQAPVNDTSLPFRIAADAIEMTEGRRFLRARGDVRINREDWTLYADEVEVDQQEEIFVARGSVLLFDRGNQIQGSSVRYNYGTGQGVIYEAHGLILPSTTFTSQELYREDERTYRIVKGRYTSCRVCQPPPYDWEIRASEMTVHPGEFLWGKNGTFWVKGVPILYTPVFSHPLTDRKTGFLTPTFGSNAQEGFIYGQQFFWAISDSQDATLGVVYRSERGVSPTVEYRYALENGWGSLNAEYLYDTELKENRYIVQFKHQQSFTSALRAKADVNVRSDKDFPDEFAIDFRNRTNLVNASSASLTYALPLHTVLLAGEFFQSRESSEIDEELLRAPELTVSSVSHPLWDQSPLLFKQRSNFVYLDEKDNIAVARLDVHPSLSVPVPLKSYITLTPSVGLRGTFYSRGAKGIEEDAITRGLVEFGTELSSRFFRTFPIRGERLHAIRHTVEPTIGYVYIPEVDQDDLPQIDGTDFISPQNRLFFLLNNRLFATVWDPNGSRRRFEFLTLTLGNSVALDPQTRTFSNLYLDSLQPENIRQAVEDDRRAIPDRPGFSKATERRFSNIVGRMSITPPWPVSLNVSGSLNPEEDVIETGNGRLSASYKDVASFGVGYTFRRGEDEDQQTLIGDVGLTILEGTRLTYLGRYDFEREVFVEHRAGLIYQTCCWALNVIYTHRNTENVDDPDNDIRVNFELFTAPARRSTDN